jgi:GntR family transcriptional regulator
MPDEKIDRESSLPYHVQLREILVERMKRGDWRPGTRIPGDEELCEIFNVSRTVVRQALQDLTYEGWIYRKRGKGTFVAEPRVSGVGLAKSLDAFYRSLRNRGIETKMQNLEKGIIPADKDIAEILEVEPMAPLIRIVQLFSIKDQPLFIANSYIPYDLCRELIFADLTRRSIYEFLEQQCNISLGGAQRKVSALLAGKDQAELLEIDVGDPLLYLESVGFSSEGKPLEYLVGYFHGKRLKFEVEILEVVGNE